MVTLVPALPLVGVKLVIFGCTEKLLLLTAVPAAVVTLIGAVTAVTGTVALIDVGETNRKLAVIPPNFTAVTPVNVVPVIVTLVPALPVAGVKLVMVGKTRKLLVLVSVVVPLIMLIRPVVAAAGTMAVMALSETIVNVAVTALNLTAVAPVKPLPLIDTVVPTGPLAGVNPPMPAISVKLVALRALPSTVVMVIGPVVAPTGTVALIDVAEETLKLALTLLNCTEVAVVNPEPVMVTLAAAAPLAGVKLVSFGNTINLLLLVSTPAAVVTVMRPVLAVLGTVARSDVAEIRLKLAATPLNFTAVVPLRLLAVMVTIVLVVPLAGVKLFNPAMIVKPVALLAVPPAVVTEIGPELAPCGTVAVIDVAES
jgi:hypothetical protein